MSQVICSRWVTRAHFQKIVSFIWIAVLIGSVPGLATASDARTLELNAALEVFADQGAAFWRLNAPSAGILTVEVVSTGPERVPVRLGLAESCDAVVLESSPTKLVLAIRGAGTWGLRVVARDSGWPVGWHEITTRFVETEVLEDIWFLEDRFPEDIRVTRTRFYARAGIFKAEPEVVDPDPDNVTFDEVDRLLASFITWNGVTLPLLPPSRLMAKAEPEVVDPDPDNLTHGTSFCSVH